MRKIFRSLILPPAALAMVAGASHAGETAPAANTEVQEMKPAPATPISGKVVEVLPVGVYNYICVEKDGVKRWAAIPKNAVSVGQQVEVRPGMDVTNYSSKKLNRKFDKIVFSDGLTTDPVAGAHKVPGAGMPAGHPKVGAEGAKQSVPALVSVEGTVAEVLKTEDYSFVSVDQDGVKSWVRVDTQTTVKPGEKVRFAPGAEKLKFQSGELGRTFERIVLSSGLDPVK